MSRRFRCRKCEGEVRIPFLWAIGVEMVVKCPSCGRRFYTGYITGAIIMALSMAVALAAANLCVWLFSSYTIPFFALLVIPGGIALAYPVRKWWMLRRKK